MEWFFIALFAPFLWATTNHIDKLLLEKYFKSGGVGTLLIFSSLIGIVILPFLFFAYNDIFDISLVNTLILLADGILAAFVLWLYFEALRDDEASIVVVFYQLIPVFGYIFGYFILNEILSARQLIAMTLIIAGAVIISFKIDEENKFSLRKKTLFLMTSAAILSALDSVIFKFVLIQENLWQSLFWENVGLGIFGILIFIFIKKYRRNFISMVKTNSKNIFSLNVLNEILYMVGNFLFAYAYLLAPVALVLLVNSYQPIFVFIIGIILTLYLPHLGTENIRLKNVVQKFSAILIIAIGTYLLF